MSINKLIGLPKVMLKNKVKNKYVFLFLNVKKMFHCTKILVSLQ